MLILNDMQAIHWAFAGLGISAVTLALLVIANRRLGVSTGFEDVCALVLRAPYFHRDSLKSEGGWRLPLLGGLVLGGVLSAVLGGGWSPTWDLGMFDERIGWGPGGKVVWMFAGGLLIGFGTRLAGGCTSGHGIFGLSNFELPSLVATACFMGSGLVVTQVLYRLVLR